MVRGGEGAMMGMEVANGKRGGLGGRGGEEGITRYAVDTGRHAHKRPLPCGLGQLCNCNRDQRNLCFHFNNGDDDDDDDEYECLAVTSPTRHKTRDAGRSPRADGHLVCVVHVRTAVAAVTLAEPVVEHAVARLGRRARRRRRVAVTTQPRRRRRHDTPLDRGATGT